MRRKHELVKMLRKASNKYTNAYALFQGLQTDAEERIEQIIFEKGKSFNPELDGVLLKSSKQKAIVYAPFGEEFTADVSILFYPGWEYAEEKDNHALEHAFSLFKSEGEITLQDFPGQKFVQYKTHVTLQDALSGYFSFPFEK